ncbi:hypothetical protein EN780_32285 [Mesorhizobium sp. M4B.F.Ca.ET.089.01.1.1]|nr:hypothetical protein EN780_32285 [Mesorhizobium sp. M4B.F.Ca.ET.089.01.1.1]
MPKTGRLLIGMVAGFKSEWWPVFDRNGGRLHVGIRTLAEMRRTYRPRWLDQLRATRHRLPASPGIQRLHPRRNAPTGADPRIRPSETPAAEPPAQASRRDRRARLSPRAGVAHGLLRLLQRLQRARRPCDSGRAQVPAQCRIEIQATACRGGPEAPRRSS